MQGILQALKEKVLICDGAIGTMLYARGINPEVCYEHLNISNPEVILALHQEYIAAGADIIETNTFGANISKLADYGYENEAREINLSAAKQARKAAGREVFVAGSIGPLNKFGPDQFLSDERITGIYAQQAFALAEGGVDCFILETFSNLEHIRIALAACKKAADLPVICQMVFFDGLRTGYGNSIASVVRALSNDGADVIGANCGHGPATTLEVIKNFSLLSDKFISAQPNAGYPQVIDGRTMYITSPDYFSAYAVNLVKAGANIVGGCCGTTPEYISSVAKALKGAKPLQKDKARVSVSSAKEPPAGSLRPAIQADVIVELLPPKDADSEKLIDTALMLKAKGAKVLSFPENPLAQARMSAIAAAGVVKQRTQIDAIFHYTCRDRNLIGLQSDLLGACALGLNKVLAVTGDPAVLGNTTEASSVFDLNSLSLVRLISNMRRELGLDISIGVAFNPNFEDISAQLERLKRKVDAGACFALTQPLFDKEKILAVNEKTKSLGIPVYFGILPLVSKRNADFLHNEVPGMQIPAYIRQRMDIDDKQRAQEEGLSIVLELVEAVKGTVKSFYLISPLNKYEISAKIIGRLS